jgi:CubicO group peptidase (beta-lactamase class C family)
MTESISIEGTCAPRFAAVRDAFAANFAAGREVGASFAATLDGAVIVDLWGGHADDARTREWTRDTIVNVFSTTKAMTALCVHLLVDRGALDVDAPVARYWPEFAQKNKDRIPVRWLLGHRSGLAAIRETLPNEALYDWNAMCAALAAEEPWWRPGEGHGYHALTIGWLVGELVRRISGRSLGTYYRQEVAEPLGIDFHIGLPESEHARVAEMSGIPLEVPPDGGVKLAEIILSNPEGLSARAFMNPPSLALGVNHREWRTAEIPGANGHGNARALARVYGALSRGGEVDGVHVLSPAGIARCHQEQSSGPDQVLQITTRFGLGFMLSQKEREARFGPNPRAFGHPGAGGSVGFADPDTKIGFGYVMNRMGPHILLDPRAVELIEATYRSIGN